MYALRLKPGTYPPPLVGGMYVAQRVLPSASSFTPDIKAARIWGSYQQAYSYLDENLYGMAEVVAVDSVPSRVKVPFLALIGFALAVTAGGAMIATRQLTNPCPVKSENKALGSCYQESQARLLTIGIVSPSPNDDYNALAAYLQAKLGRLVKIDRDTPFEKIPDRIARKKWDIAFTRSPIFSIDAESHRYLGVTRMFPNEPPYYRAALYVRSKSPIQSIADIKPTTTIALGSPESAPTFYLPIYALYGKSLRVGTGYRPGDVLEMVEARKVDIGAGRYSTVEDHPGLRIIYVSKAIPGAGVYLSPLLSIPEQQQLKAALLNAPPEIQAKANYSNNQIPKYDELRKIILKTENFLNCPGVKVNSFDLKKTVDLFCQEQRRDPNAIEGKVREYKVLTQGNIQFKVVTPKNRIYFILVPKQILNQIPIEPLNAIDRSVQLEDVKPRLLSDGTRSVKITRPNQLSLLSD